MRGEIEADSTLPSVVAAAHELKAPLGLIRQLALARQYYDETQAEAAMQRIVFTAERSLRLIESLTKTYQTGSLQSEPILVGRLCEEVAHELSPLCKEIDQKIEVRIPTQPLLAVGNRDLFSSVVFGLCDNALMYAKNDEPIKLVASKQNENVRVSVSDHGPALSKTELADLHTRLGKAPQTINQRPGSSGLGLYIAGQFAQAMEGTLGLVSKRRGGQTFFIDVPRSCQLSFLTV